MSATSIDRTSTRRLSVDRWRMRDVAASVRASAVETIALDAPPMMPVTHGIAPLAAGLACGDYWRAALGNSSAEDGVRAYRRRLSVRVVYGAEYAAIGDELDLVTTVDGRKLTTIVDGPRGRVATVEQGISDTPVTAEPAPMAQLNGGGHLNEHLARIRVARWVYISGEFAPVHGNHVTAVAAGLPSAIVPASLLVAIAERALFPDAVPCGELIVEFSQPLFAGDSISVPKEHDANDIRVDGAGGTAAKARRV